MNILFYIGGNGDSSKWSSDHEQDHIIMVKRKQLQERESVIKSSSAQRHQKINYCWRSLRQQWQLRPEQVTLEWKKRGY